MSAGARDAAANTAAPTDPASMDEVLARRMKDTLRRLMAADVDQSMGVKELRQTVAAKLGLVCEGKAWKKWFNSTVSELDDELAAAEDVEQAVLSQSNLEEAPALTAASATKAANQLPSAKPSPYEDVAVDGIGDAEDLEELDDIDGINSGSDDQAAPSNNIHNDAVPQACDENYLKEVRQHVFSLVEADTVGAITMSDVKSSVTTRFENDFSSPAWKNWLKGEVQRAIDELETRKQEDLGTSNKEDLKTPLVTKGKGAGGLVKSISDPSELDAVTAALLKDTLRTLMVDDVEQKLNVRDLRQAVSEKVGIPCDGKAWKKWFNQTVGDLDDELAAADAAAEDENHNQLQAAKTDARVEDPVGAQKVDPVDADLIEDVGGFDDLDASVDDGGAESTVPLEVKQMARPSVVADKKHNVDTAEASDSEYLKQVNAFVFKIVEADEEGTITMKEVRRQASSKFDGNDFSSASWKKWLKASVQSAIDKLDALEAGGDDVEEVVGLQEELEEEPLNSANGDGDALEDVQLLHKDVVARASSFSAPSEMDAETAAKVKACLRKLMVDDVDQQMNVKKLRERVTDTLGMEFDGKAWKKWFNSTVGEIDDELAAASGSDGHGSALEDQPKVFNDAPSPNSDNSKHESSKNTNANATKSDLGSTSSDVASELDGVEDVVEAVEEFDLDEDAELSAGDLPPTPAVVEKPKHSERRAHNVDTAEASDSEYLKQVNAFVFKIVEADEEGTITMKEVRRQASSKFDGNDFSSASWKKWLKASVQSAIDKLDALEADRDDVEEVVGLQEELEEEPLNSANGDGDALEDVQLLHKDVVARASSFSAPSEMDAETAAKVKACLRKLMVDDVDQQMNVKKLRERVTDTLGMEFDGKAWKKWFNSTVGEIDDELAAASGSGTEGSAGDSTSAQNAAHTGKSAAATHQDVTADTISVSLQEAVPFEHEEDNRHDVDDAEASGPEYLKQVSDFVFALVEADDEGQITMKEVRRKVADEFDNDFSSSSWKKWLKSSVQAAIDKIDGDAASQDESGEEPAQAAAAGGGGSGRDRSASGGGGGDTGIASSSKLHFVDNPDELSKETSEHIRDLLRQLMFDDVDQTMNVKKLRTEVTRQSGWEFQHKGWKWWFNTVVGELDDELADSEADLLPPLPGTTSKQEASSAALETSHVAAETGDDVKSGPTVDSATDEQLDSIEDAINAAIDDGVVAEAAIRKRVAGAVGFSLETKEWQAYVRDVVREFAEEDSNARAETSAPAAKVFEDPADLDAAMAATIVRVLREIMVEDVDQLLDVKALRKAVEERVNIGMKTKPWKKWFGDRVAELDVELGDGASDEEEDAQPKQPGTTKATSSKSAAAEEGNDDVSFDSAAESANFSDEERLDDEGSKNKNIEAADHGTGTGTDFEAAPKVAKCSDEFLDEIEDEIQKVLDADSDMSEASIRARIGKALKVSFEAKEWVKYCHEVVVDCRLEKYAEVQDPEDITPTLRVQLRKALKRIMVDDTEQNLDAKACRGLVTEAVGVAFKSKAMKGWFGDLFLEVDDELADEEEAAN